MHNTAKSAEAFLAQFLGRTAAELPAVTGMNSSAPRPAPSLGVDSSAPRPAKPPSLYDEYIQAKRARGDDTSKLSAEAFERSLQKQLEQARAQIGDDVELKVRVTAEKVSVVAVRKK